MPEIFVSPENINSKNTSGEIRHHGRRNMFSAFNLYPEHISFETREKDEKIVLMLRQHPIVNLKWIFVSVILFLCPAIIQKTGLLSLLPTGYQIIAMMTWYLVSFAYAIEGFFSWYFNVFMITTMRVVDVDFYNLIDKRVSDAEIEKIQDVSYSTSGPLGTTLNYGDVLVQTAAEITELVFERVPHPDRVADVLGDLRKAVH